MDLFSDELLDKMEEAEDTHQSMDILHNVSEPLWDALIENYTDDELIWFDFDNLADGVTQPMVLKIQNAAKHMSVKQLNNHIEHMFNNYYTKA